MSIEILSPGLYTTIQDEGRFGYQQFGMPVSGAMDLYSMYLGNLLVGNPKNTECVEATVLLPKIRFLDYQFFAVTGATCLLTLNGVPVEQNRALFARTGDVLEATAAQKGCRIYLTLSGGIDVPDVMGSKSTYAKGQIGGLDGRPLKVGDVLATTSVTMLPNFIHRKIPDSYLHQLNHKEPIRVVLGPQETSFSAKGLDTFLHETYTISKDSDRMGYRLDGAVIEHSEGNDGNIISDAIAFGSIQIPGHGNPIIMMSDRQTTGGYTKIGTVITADLPKIAQMKAGETLRFSLCRVEEAIQIYRNQIIALQELEKLLNEEEIKHSQAIKLQIDNQEFMVQIHEIAES